MFVVRGFHNPVGYFAYIPLSTIMLASRPEALYTASNVVVVEGTPMTVHDPVCGMEIELERAFAKREHARWAEPDSLAKSGEGYAKYAAETPAFLPRLIPAGIHRNAA